VCNHNRSTESKLQVLSREITNNAKKCATHTDVRNQKEVETLDLLTASGKSPIYINLKLTKFAKAYHTVVQQLEHKSILSTKHDSRANLTGK
jgi:hypothetical protein